MNENLLIAIKRSGLHQYQIAGRAKVSDTYFTRILYGRVEPSQDIKDRIARALGLQVGEIFDGNGQGKKHSGKIVNENVVAN